MRKLTGLGVVGIFALLMVWLVPRGARAQAAVESEHGFTQFESSVILPPGFSQLVPRLSTVTFGEVVPREMMSALRDNALRVGRQVLGEPQLELTRFGVANGMGLPGRNTWHFDGARAEDPERVGTLVIPLGAEATGVKFMAVSPAELEDLLADPSYMQTLSGRRNRTVQTNGASIHRRLTPHAHGVGLRIRAWYGRPRR